MYRFDYSMSPLSRLPVKKLVVAAKKKPEDVKTAVGEAAKPAADPPKPAELQEASPIVVQDDDDHMPHSLGEDDSDMDDIMAEEVYIYLYGTI